MQRSQVVPYNASRVYCADRLLVPTPTPRITPPREGLLAVRTGLGVRTLPEVSGQRAGGVRAACTSLCGSLSPKATEGP